MQRESPFFTIITVCFNSEKTIRRTIESVLKQSFQDFEYIIVDGKSTDRTIDIIRSYEGLFAGRLRFISEPDSGIYNAMNKGIRHATGRVIGIVNSDDYLENNSLEIVKKKYSYDAKYQVLYGAVRYIDHNNKELFILFSNINNIKNDMIQHPGVFVSRAVYSDITSFNERYKSASDYDFILNIVESGKVDFIPVYNILSNFTVGGISSEFLSLKETNKIKFLHHIINRKEYILKVITLFFKQILHR